MQYAINNMDEPIPPNTPYDYFAYLDLIIFLYMYLTIMIAHPITRNINSKSKTHLLMQAQVQEEQ